MKDSLLLSQLELSDLGTRIGINDIGLLRAQLSVGRDDAHRRSRSSSINCKLKKRLINHDLMRRVNMAM